MRHTKGWEQELVGERPFFYTYSPNLSMKAMACTIAAGDHGCWLLFSCLLRVVSKSRPLARGLSRTLLVDQFYCP